MQDTQVQPVNEFDMLSNRVKLDNSGFEQRIEEIKQFFVSNQDYVNSNEVTKEKNDLLFEEIKDKISKLATYCMEQRYSVTFSDAQMSWVKSVIKNYTYNKDYAQMGLHLFKTYFLPFASNRSDYTTLDITIPEFTYMASMVNDFTHKGYDERVLNTFVEVMTINTLVNDLYKKNEKEFTHIKQKYEEWVSAITEKEELNDSMVESNSTVSVTETLDVAN